MRNLIPHFIQEEYQQENYEGNFEALTMFVDVSGFTPMTQALMKEGHEGAEILAFILNDVFDRMVNAVYAHGGFISVFAGDAFTAIFPLNPELTPDATFAWHVLACGDRVQAIFRRHGLQKTHSENFACKSKSEFRVGMSTGASSEKTTKPTFFAATRLMPVQPRSIRPIKATLFLMSVWRVGSRMCHALRKVRGTSNLKV